MLSWDTLRALPRLSSYAAAVAHEANTKPIRGDEWGTKPLGKRDQKYRCIYRDEATGNIEVGFMWSILSPRKREEDKREPQPMLTYHPDNTLTLGPRIHSSEREMIYSLMGLNIERLQYNWMRYNGEYTRVPEDGARFALPGWALDQVVPLFPLSPPCVHHVKRKEKNRVLREEGYAPFRTWLSAAVKVREAPPSVDEFAEVFGVKEEYREIWGSGQQRRYMHMVNFPANYYHGDWRYSLNALPGTLKQVTSDDHTQWYKAGLLLMRGRLSQALSLFDDMLHYVHADQWLEKVPLAKGSYPRYDRWQRYVEGHAAIKAGEQS